MYKVLLVDDERIILDGISAVVEWKQVGTELIGTARNGLEAYRMMEQNLPDIIITDIRMPGLDGLQLVEKIHANGWSVKVVILSGYNEFDYAKQAMQFGVKHYLLKPCSEHNIMDALTKVVEEIEQEQARQSFVTKIKHGLDKVMPYAKEQFLKEFVTNKTYGKQDWDYFRKLFNITLAKTRVRLALFLFEGEVDFEHMFALKNIAEDILGRPPHILSTTIGEDVLVLLEDREQHVLFQYIEQIRVVFHQYYKISMTVALSDPGEVHEARKLYRETLECIRHRFYLGEGSVITKNDISGSYADDKGREIEYDEEKLCLSLRAGDQVEAHKQLQQFFEQLQPDTDETVVKSHCIQLFLTMIRECSDEQMQSYYRKFIQFEQMDTVSQLSRFLQQTATEIAAAKYEAARNRHSHIVGEMMRIAAAHLHDPDLSLSWMSRTHLYMHPDYLGKLFRQETGDKFSTYVVKARVEQAKKLIDQADDVRIFEIAEKTGFGHNPQYFSQVFKKNVGCTPSDYIKRSNGS